MKKTIHPLLIISLLALFSCTHSTDGNDEGNKDIVISAGTVTFIGVEGGFYGIVTDDGSRYDPINLPPEYRQDSLQIRFMGIIRRDLDSFHMWGQLIELMWVRRTEEK